MRGFVVSPGGALDPRHVHQGLFGLRGEEFALVSNYVVEG